MQTGTHLGEAAAGLLQHPVEDGQAGTIGLKSPDLFALLVLLEFPLLGLHVLIHLADGLPEVEDGIFDLVDLLGNPRTLQFNILHDCHFTPQISTLLLVNVLLAQVITVEAIQLLLGVFY